MKHYSKAQTKRYKSFIVIIIALFVVFNLLLTLFDKKVMPSVLNISETMMRAESIKTINTVSVEVFDEEASKKDIVKIERDENNKINSISADTILLNKLSSEIAIRCNERLEELGAKGIEVPLGWMTDKSVYYNLGPEITIEMEPLGNIESSYESVFESAGINQTRHKIYLNVKAKIKIIIPMYTKEFDVDTQIPLSETIIVGEIPDAAIQLND
ncbi:sporulation protein YunB [Clostridium baratii]|uniref:sporulation protein YunB n=1 Tax=Clostridium baratii TaxID=1561 RepID=UPI0009A28536|nr:sporulation protein YunB [Clostridium baratii]OPF51938.1 sporulation protein YunB [Clostridium baratii]OPF53583.1 sporulation protein YunB [Clostridium baratii]OPF56484.1 sporulation protein YunB [Clostridium baratii]OPF60630.1 sporulation protein YunB [Clostridium baratii]